MGSYESRIFFWSSLPHRIHVRYIYTYIQVISMVNVAKYIIHGSYGYKKNNIKTDESTVTRVPIRIVGPNQLDQFTKAAPLNFGYPVYPKKYVSTKNLPRVFFCGCFPPWFLFVLKKHVCLLDVGFQVNPPEQHSKPCWHSVILVV